MDINTIAAWAGLLFGFGALIKSFIETTNDKDRLKLDKAEFVQDASLEIAEKYREEKEDREKEIVNLRTEFDRRISNLERALTNAHKKIDRLMAIIRGLIQQLIDADIEPLHTLEELEELDKKEK
jgi:signal recognition particle GTPase